MRPNGCELELKERMEIDLKTDDAHSIELPTEDMTNELVPSISKKIKSSCMKMSGYGINASSDLFYLTHTKIR